MCASGTWWTSRRKTAAIVIYAVLLAAFAVLLPLFLIFSDPNSPHRPAVMRFLDETCGREPTNAEERGTFRNEGDREEGVWRIAVYDGRRKHRLFFGLGGDDFRRSAAKEPFTHRVNAGSSGEAIRLLRNLLAEKAAGTEIAEVAIFDHGKPGEPYLGAGPINAQFFEELAAIKNDAVPLKISFYGCSVGKGDAGRAFMERLAKEYGYTVAASEEPVEWNIFAIGSGRELRIHREAWAEVTP